MKTSSRTRILVSALELAGKEGFDHVTFEALAERTGLTRGGVVYHFRTRDALIEAVASLLVERWREEALAALGKPVADATQPERVAALARSTIEGAIRPDELAFMFSGRSEASRLVKAWEGFYHEWVGDLAALAPGQRVALLAAEGCWSHLAAGMELGTLGDEDTFNLVIAMAAGQAPLEARPPEPEDPEAAT